MLCPLVSLFTGSNTGNSLELVFGARQAGQEEIESGEKYNILPESKYGKISLYILIAGLIAFFTGVLMGSEDLNYASHTAVAGMLIFFMGGWLRTRFS